ncbi:hypothetical protein IFVP182_C190028 [Vibrio parahaemolyticus]
MPKTTLNLSVIIYFLKFYAIVGFVHDYHMIFSVFSNNLILKFRLPLVGNLNF